MILDRAGRAEAALAELDRLDALDPPPNITALVSGMRERLEAEVAGTGTAPPTTAPTPAP